MKIVYIQGGLGNQLFQYAFFKYLLKKGHPRVYLDGTASFISKHGGFELKRLFPAIATDKRVLPCWKARPLFFGAEVFRHLLRVDLRTNQEVPKGKKVWWKAHWQEYRYPDYVKDELLHDLVFIPMEDEKNKATLAQITSSQAVSIHVRRGDYRQPHIRPSLGDICSLAYYQQAIAYIRQQVENPRFFVFSDDPAWVKENLSLPQGTILINWNRDRDSFRDMQLMSHCRHHIIANSTFSWWGAWLNPNPEKIVVCPAKWFHNYPKSFAENLLPPDWYRIENTHPNVSLVLDDDIIEQDLTPVWQQSYTDFELIRNGQTPQGNHVFRLTKSELSAFRDKKYFQKKLIQYFKTGCAD